MDDCLKDDLSYLFENPHQFDDWLSTWRDSYLQYLDNYKIRTVTELDHIRIFHMVSMGSRDEYHFEYWYRTTDNKIVSIVCKLFEDWIIYGEGDLLSDIDTSLEGKINFSSNSRYSRTEAGEKKLKQYATLFLKKTESYLEKTKHIMLGDVIATKLIRWTTANLNPKEQILLTRSALESNELDDLLK
jgi:hypothetical protein